ncbi:hypothetical protein FJZ53_05960 [Candidatus Woesearchaeota archaeon]|nr:hypothetical protein [Candidatus Woesearchaeota archaeon]
MGCENFKIDDSDLTDYIYMEVRNGMGEQLTGVSFTLTSGDCSGTIAASDPNPSFTWNDGNLTKLNFTCSGGFTGSRAKADIAISYTKGGLSHTASGTITAPVE